MDRNSVTIEEVKAQFVKPKIYRASDMWLFGFSAFVIGIAVGIVIFTILV